MSSKVPTKIKTLDESKVIERKKPIISETIIDTDSQRYYILALFILIQAWKLYDLYIIHAYDTLNTSNNEIIPSSYLFGFLNPKISFIFKYGFFDSLLILIIPFLNIPKLTFTPLLSIILLCSINFLTILLTCNFSFTLTSIFISLYRVLVPEKELSIMEKYVNTDSIINQSDHFKGKKIIRYAPDSSIKINPFSQQFCINPIYGEKIKIPIRVDSTYDLQFLQLKYLDFSNSETLYNFTQKDLRKYVVSDYYNSPYIKFDPSVLADNNVKIIELPADNPGYYSIKMATDKKDKVIRSYRSDTIIPLCPEASFIVENSFVSDKCIDDSIDDLKISLIGVPPFTLYYEEEINGKLSKLPQTIIENPLDINSPLNSNDKKNNKKINYPSEFLSDLSWAKSQQLTTSISRKKLQKSGKYIYTIDRIVDGFGNVIKYSPDPHNNASFVSFDTHPVPLLNLVDTNQNKPILTSEDKYLNIDISKVESSQLSNEGPFDFVFQYTNENSSVVETFNQSFDFSKDSKSKIKALNPGNYKILQGKTKYCPCKIGSSSLNVLSAKIPEMEINLEPIVDNCVGTIGFKFNFDFVGSPPFEISYKIAKLDPKNSTHVLKVEKYSSLKSDSTTLEYDFQPANEGSYFIEFTSLNDNYYKNQVKFDQEEYRYITYFKQKPKAFFNKRDKVQRLSSCFGESKNITLSFEGKAPFNVTYNIISPDFSTETFTLNNINEDKIYIQTPELLRGGEYIVSLKNVSDSSDCDVDFKGQEVHIDVKNDMQELSFQQEEIFEIVQGSNVVIPLKSQSNELIDLIYSYTPIDSTDSTNVTLKKINPSDGISVGKSGTYKLISFKQGNCRGKISNDYTVQIRHSPLPTIQIASNQSLLVNESYFVKQNICQNQNDYITVEVSGVTPFIIKYEIEHPNGRIEKLVEQINNNKLNIDLNSESAGEYTYTITGVFDSVYTEEVIKDLKRSKSYEFDNIIFKNTVTSLPSGRFLENHEKIQSCVSILNDITKLTPINVELEGLRPLSLYVNIYHELNGELENVAFENIDTSLVDLLSIYDFLSIGSHTITINKVVDANGCVSDESKLLDQSITIHISDVPKIRHLIEESNQLSDFDSESNSNYYCVGDQITYMLNGAPPFSIDYGFNDEIQHVEVQGNYFKRRALKPGQFNIKALSDSVSKECMVDYSLMNRNDLKAVIYDLPSVEIVQGDSIEEDIHEGEQVEIKFLLTGTPPFKLTYIRKELDDSSKIVETEIADEIMANEYRIMANLEGTYEAIEIQDKYCIARNHGF